MSWLRSRLPLAGLLLLFVATCAQAESNKVKRGRTLYLRYCTSCHGLSGEGGRSGRSLFDDSTCQLASIAQDNSEAPSVTRQTPRAGPSSPRRTVNHFRDASSTAFWDSTIAGI